jgi:hypothetical protein
MRQERLVILLTKEEKEKLNKEAEEKNTTLSLLVRAKLFKGNNNE